LLGYSLREIHPKYFGIGPSDLVFDIKEKPPNVSGGFSLTLTKTKLARSLLDDWIIANHCAMKRRKGEIYL